MDIPKESNTMLFDMSYFNLNEKRLIKGMLNFNVTKIDKQNSFLYRKEDSWQFAREIIKKGGFLSQINNVGKYMKELIRRGVVEERDYEYQDKRKRTLYKKQYRLIPNLYVFETLYIEDEIESLNLNESSYFKH